MGPIELDDAIPHHVRLFLRKDGKTKVSCTCRKAGRHYEAMGYINPQDNDALWSLFNDPHNHHWSDE